MALLGFKGVTHAFGEPVLLDGVDLQIEVGERIGLLGRNGSGKTTLLRLLLGDLEPNGGEVVRSRGVRVAGLEQEVPGDLPGTVAEQVTAALAGLPLAGSWETDQRLGRVVARLDLDPEAPVADLSAGSKRRVLLARALVTEPDLLVLDEPTNHLDIDTIVRLEETLLRRAGALIFVTHDRMFLQRLATRILDLDRGELRSYACDYATYLQRRDAELEAEAAERANFDKKLAREEAWIRRGVKHRRKRNQGRVRALEALREESRARRETVGRVKGRLQEAERSGQIVLRAEGLTHGFGGDPVLRDVETVIMRGDRVGVVGPNGCGKTTLLRLLLGDLEPQEGLIHHGANVAIARFDQLQDTLDESLTPREIVSDDADTVTVGGRTRHVVGYLQDFLFTPEQIREPIRTLSGGERNRLKLARILARPCNLLVLDEPTNDLDVETLEFLEGLLLEYEGTLLLVSHDRTFLNNIVTSTLVFEGSGRVKEYAGGYDDALRQRLEASPTTTPRPKKARASRPAGPRRLSFNEKRELEELPQRIELLEAEKDALGARMSDASFYKRDGSEIAAASARLAAMESELGEAYARWESLESIADGERPE
jgi:ATP-binding cassette subfamily F protein uup